MSRFKRQTGLVLNVKKLAKMFALDDWIQIAVWNSQSKDCFICIFSDPHDSSTDDRGLWLREIDV